MGKFLVIGAGFGDEGKGLVTDFLACERSAEVVCRFNGGAQAGHTVVGTVYDTSEDEYSDESVRHVFHHHGAGTLAGATTYLAPQFILNPMLFRGERRALNRIVPHLDDREFRVSHTCCVTTFVDMLLNEMIEEHRGDARHGSVGLGINETIVRSSAFLRLMANDLVTRDHSSLESLVKDVIHDWVPHRLEELGLDPDLPYVKSRLEYINSERILDAWVTDAKYMAGLITLMNPHQALSEPDVIYEGAQGLLLDRDHEFYPNVTPTHTGSDYVIGMVKEWELDVPDVYYVTRTYMTRHGAGPFPSEDEHLRYHDETNQPNSWQGALRFGHLDVDLIASAINKDKAKWTGVVDDETEQEFKLAVTHVDQYVDQDALRDLLDKTGLTPVIESQGPDRENVFWK